MLDMSEIRGGRRARWREIERRRGTVSTRRMSGIGKVCSTGEGDADVMIGVGAGWM